MYKEEYHCSVVAGYLGHIFPAFSLSVILLQFKKNIYIVPKWIKYLLNFLTGVILWRRLISLLPQMQFNFCVAYEIMRSRL